MRSSTARRVTSASIDPIRHRLLSKSLSARPGLGRSAVRAQWRRLGFHPSPDTRRFSAQTTAVRWSIKTKLTGGYDFALDFSMEEMGGMNANQSVEGRPSIFTIVENLGLKRESRKAEFEVLGRRLTPPQLDPFLFRL
jgi:hypothetical protein